MSNGPCRDCVSGTVSTETPTGTEATIHGVSTYVARPEGDSKGLIVYIPDAFGWKFTNGRVLADKYASKGGYTVYIPDFMNGHDCPISVMTTMDSIMAPASILTTIFVKPVLVLKAILTFIPFVFFCRESVTRPRIISYFQALRTDPETSNLKIGVAGFCWGGLHAVRLAQDPPSTRVHRVGAESGQLQPLADVAYTAHPSMVSVPADFEKVTIPLSVAVGDVDIVMKRADSNKVKDILEKKGDDHEVVIYPGGKHGFAVRGDPSDPTQKELAEQAEAQALAWFKRWIG